LFGVHELASFLTNNLVYGLSILTAFFIGYLLFKSSLAGIYAALIFSLTPEFMMWANTTAVEPSAALFPGLAILCALVFIRSRETKSLFLLAIVAAFAVQFRPESIMFLAVIGMMILFWSRDELKRGEFYLMLAIFFLLIIPHLVHLYAVKNVGWGSSGPKFSLDYFKGNFKANGLFYIKNIRFPVLFAILFILGIVLKQGKEEREAGTFVWKEKSLVLLWFLLFWGIFIFFYAGSYNYGADVRFSLLSSIPIALLAGNGAASLGRMLSHGLKFKHMNYILSVIIILSFLPFLPFVRAITQEAWGARADHKFAKEMAKVLPDDSVVLTHNPNMFLLWGKSAAQASLVTEQRSHFCKNILEKFDCKPVMSFKERNYKYELYKVEKRKKKKEEKSGSKKGRKKKKPILKK